MPILQGTHLSVRNAVQIRHECANDVHGCAREAVRYLLGGLALFDVVLHTFEEGLESILRPGEWNKARVRSFLEAASMCRQLF